MQFWIATIIFIATYIAIASEKVHKTTAALLGSALMLLFILPGPSHSEKIAPVPDSVTFSDKINSIIETITAPVKEIIEKDESIDHIDTYGRYVNFNVIFTLAGMMILVNILSGTGIFQYIAIKCAKFAKGCPVKTMLLLVISSAVMSAFLDNVTTVLLMAPITFIVASQLGLNPIPFLMAETLAANIGGTATLIGDPPNLIIGSVAKFDFMAFIINLAPFIIILTAGYCLFLKLYYGKKMVVTVEKRAKIMEMDESGAITDKKKLWKAGIIMVLTLIGFLLHGMFHLQPCVIAMSGAALALTFCKVNVDHSLEKVEWSTLFFFMGLFIVVSGAEHVGLMEEIGNLLQMTKEWNPLITILMVMWISGILAAVMNCVSYTAAMVAILGVFLSSVPAFRDSIQLQHLMWWGLSLSVCLGANATMVGAAANMVAVGVAEKSNNKVSFITFMKYGIPVALYCLIASSIYISLRYFLFCR